MTSIAPAPDAPVVEVRSHYATREAVLSAVNVIATWMTQHLKIIDKAGQLIPLVPNTEQRLILYHAVEQEMCGLPVRIIILKSRKIGCSTIIEALGYYLHTTRAHFRGMVTAQDSEASRTIWEMTRRFHGYDPEARSLRTTQAGLKEMHWAEPHGSRFSVGTAGKGSSLARSDTLLFWHGSEIPHWTDAMEALLAALNSVPPDGGFVFLESTAQGYEEFKERWDNAVEGRRRAGDHSIAGFVPLFFSWLDHPEYRRAIPDDYDWGVIDDDEIELQGLGADLEQLYWRRCVMDEFCGGDPALYRQENPATPSQSFLASGSRRIPASVITRHRQLAEAKGPGRRFRLVWDGDEIDAREDDWSGMYWECWETPDQWTDYTAFADIAEGIPADPGNPRSEHDRTRAFVLNRRELRQAARWEGPAISETDMGRELRKVATWFNMAWASPEINNTGKATLLVMVEAEYEHLYQRQSEPDAFDREQERQLWGWRTTSGNRDVMIADWIDACRPRPETKWEGRIEVYSPGLAHEEDTFIRTKTGKAEHGKGYFDDELFAAMGAWQLHLLCPRQHFQRLPPRCIPDFIPREARLGDPVNYAGGTDRDFILRRRNAGLNQESTA